MIRYSAFTKSFGRHCAVQSMSLAVEQGEVVALLGPNGSGKTTALKAAVGLIHPTSGEVLIGEPARPATHPKAREVLSFLPQRVGFPESLTGWEVVDFYRRLRGVPCERTTEVLEKASLNGAARRSVGTYSGGMIQRLGLAVAVLADTQVLLLDEPTAALDPDGLCTFYGLVEQRRREGKTVFFSSHQLGDAERLADRFAVLVEGRLVASLARSELSERLSSHGIMRLRLPSLPERSLERVRLITPGATWSGGELVVPGPAQCRPAVLDLLRAEGLVVQGLTVEEGRLDVLYRELVGEQV